MLLFSSRARPLSPRLLLFLTVCTICPARCFAADLQDDTLQAFERYVQASEARMAREQRLPDDFLYIESLSQAEQQPVWSVLKRGDAWINSLESRDESGRQIKAPHGTITHTIGDIFIPNAAIGQALAVLQDYEHYQDIYKPEVVRSRLVSHQGNTFETSFRAHKETPWTSITLNVNTEVLFSIPDLEHASSRSHSTRVAQVENAGKSDEHEDTVGHDSGYLWRLNTYWRFEARDGGVVAEWESIALSRDIPFLLRWIVRPYVERLARTTALGTLVATRNEVRRRAKAATNTRQP